MDAGKRPKKPIFTLLKNKCFIFQISTTVIIMKHSFRDGNDQPETSNKSVVPSRKSRRLAGQDAEGEKEMPEHEGWFTKTGLVSETDRNDFSLSNKLMLLVEIIKKSEEIGDKL